MGDRTDFNDLHVESGLAAVKLQIESALNMGESPAPSDADGDAPPDYDVVPLSAYEDDLDSPAPSVMGELVDGTGRYTIEAMLNHFSFVWGTDVAWDDLNRKQIRLSHLRHGVGRDRYKAWDESSARKWVREIRFEPSKDLGSNYVNLYNGFAMEPCDKGLAGCERIVAHVALLCRQRKEEFWWLLKWIAFPLQNPGAKMASSVIMYGSEGPGKSVLWEEVVKKIYGDYGITIGQSQLESQFTGWKSRRLFALAEEVVSRSERNHHKGALKQVVTGATHIINEKMLPEHEEGNSMNFVFLSNSTVPLELDMGDRRYLVLYVYDKPPKDHFRLLFDEINSDGVECFYHYLMNLDLGDFTAHTEPPLNDEKRELISASLPSPAYFHQQWKSGELGVPYVSATAGDLFRVFRSWCDKNNEFKRTSRYFGMELKRAMRQVRVNIHYPATDGAAGTQRVYVTEDDLELKKNDPENFIASLGKSCREFRNSMRGSSDDF